MTDTWGDGCNGAVFTFSTVDGDIVATGSLQDGFFEMVEICVPGNVPTCLVLEVTLGTFLRSEIIWSIGGVISGGAGVAENFYLLGDNDVAEGTLAPTLSLAPTVSPTTPMPSVSTPRGFGRGSRWCETPDCTGL